MTDVLNKHLHVLHIAAENAGLPGAKAGGVADVLQHIAKALIQQNCSVTTLIPSHGFLHQLPEARQLASVTFQFRGQSHSAEIYDIRNPESGPDLRHCVLHHPLLDAFDVVRQRHRIYVHDDSGQPFYHDSNRFACFSAAAAAAATQLVFGNVDVVHLHDWHAALIALLRKTDPACAALSRVRTVFSIHNLGIQGIRPLSGNPASLEAWFPNMRYEWLDVADPRMSDCVNFMATGIRLCDRIHTVSPSYAEEINYPSRKPHFFGAEGLESVIAHVRKNNRLFGILNGCEYSEPDAPAPVLAECIGYEYCSGKFYTGRPIKAPLPRNTLWPSSDWGNSRTS